MNKNQAKVKRALDFMRTLRGLDDAKRRMLRSSSVSVMTAAEFASRCFKGKETAGGALAARIARYAPLDDATAMAARHLEKMRVGDAEVAEIARLAGVARLWSMYDEEGRVSVGTALGNAAASDRGGAPSFERLVSQIISCVSATDLLDGPMRTAIVRLRQSGMAFDWVSLLVDLEDWTAMNRKVQSMWAKDFYKAAGKALNKATA